MFYVQQAILSPLRLRVNGRNIVDQQLPTLVDVTCCVRSAHPVARFYVLLGVVAQSLKPVKLFARANGRNIVGLQLPTLLRVVAPVCT